MDGELHVVEVGETGSIEVSGTEHNVLVETVVRKHLDESFVHAPTEVQLAVFLSDQVGGSLEGTVVQKLVQDLGVHLVQNYDLLVVEGAVLVLVEERDGGVEQLFPDLLRFVLDTHTQHIGQNPSHLDVRVHRISLLHGMFCDKDLVHTEHGDFDRFLDVPHTLVKVLQTVIDLVRAADAHTLLDGVVSVGFEAFKKVLGFQLAHELDVDEEGLLREGGRG